VNDRLKLWLAAFLATVAAVMTCYLYVDRPVAIYAHANLVPNRFYFDLLTRIAARHPVAVHYVTGHWLDVDDLADLAEARNFP